MRKLTFGACLLLFFVAASFADELPSHLKPNHPRLLVTDATWKRLQDRSAEDPGLNRFLNTLKTDGYSTLNLPTLTYKLEGKRLLDVSRAAFQRIVLWSFDYRVTGDSRFLRRAEQEMLTVSEFSDWNTSHFLDTSEMTAAVSLGYDWLYNDLSPASRQIIRNAIVQKGLRPGLDPKLNSWTHIENNWNQVCGGSMTIGALAVADEEPDIARQVLNLAKASIHNGLKPYQPDGVYPEGPTYWGYGTTYQVLMIAALESALGTDWQLSQSQGFLPSADYLLQMTGPTGLFFNYSDGEAKSEYAFEAALFWMAQKFHQPGLLYFQQDGLSKFETNASVDNSMQFAPLAAIWWPNDGRFPAPALPLDWYGRGINPVAVFRSSWTDPNALYLAVKGGTASASHGHMDAGSFVLDADGVRWALDLGKQDYNSLESKGIGIWGMDQKSDRWRVFRLNNFSHNTLTIDGQLHVAKGYAPIIAFSTNAAMPYITIDLSQVFEGQASKVIREFLLLPDREIAVDDNLEGLKPGDNVRWAMVTSSQVHLEGSHAVLEQGGKRLEVSVMSPPDSILKVIPANGAHDYDAPNPDARIIVMNAPAASSANLHIRVLLQPLAN
jgi:hypothetical protein